MAERLALVSAGHPKAELYRLILMDYNMPLMSGLESAQGIIELC